MSEASGKGLSRAEILEKLNVVPVFIVLNGDKNAVSMLDSVNGGETCYWHTDPAEAKAQLDAAKTSSPEVPGLHLGTSTLGAAFALGARWVSAAQHAGEARMGTAPGYEAPTMRHRLVMERGMAEEMPVYLCPKLQTPVMVPVFLDRVDLVPSQLCAIAMSGPQPLPLPLCARRHRSGCAAGVQRRSSYLRKT